MEIAMDDNVCRLDTPSDIQILVVDDDESPREVIMDFLELAGFTGHMAASGHEAIDILKLHDIDLVVTDINMPDLSGVDLVKVVKSQFTSSVLVMTGYIGKYSYEEIIEIGADDFITKPVSGQEIILRVKRILRERCLINASKKAHDDLKYAYLDTINRLSIAAEYKDEDTGDHIVRLGLFCSFLAGKMGMSRQDVDSIRYASPMHDIGKIGIPDKILLKPDKLTAEEFDIMKTHTTIGAKILDNSKSEILKMAHQIALLHHEKWDGTGYPSKIGGTDIPLGVRIVSIFDTFDALTNKRPYKEPYPIDLALKILSDQRGKQFDPRVVEAFFDHLDTILDIRGKVTHGDTLDVHNVNLSERDKEEGLVWK
jgi:putative two-component system response regulator